MRTRLRQWLASGKAASALRDKAAGAPAAAPISVDFPLPASPATSDNWLSLLPPEQPFWYRARPAKGEFLLGIGHALHVASAGPNRFAALDHAWRGMVEHWHASSNAAAFAGFAFADDNDAPLPNALIALPALLLRRTDEGATLTLTAPAGRIDESAALWPTWLEGTACAPTPKITWPQEPPLAEQAWQTRVDAALRDIAAGRLAKVVLTRQRKLLADQPVSPTWLLARLNEQQPDSVVFAHRNGHQVFLGATPERLVRLRGRQAEVDALAGTAWPGSPTLDIEKNRQEQAYVVDAVHQALTHLCQTPPSISATEEHAAGQLLHLRNRIAGQLRPEASLFDLLRSLHPTPAVGGYPNGAAQAWLNAHGERRSAWYSGGFGILQPNGDSEFSVALRSALVDGNTVELQAGAGIVAGSDAQLEWAETEAKFGTLLAAIQPDADDINRAA